MDPAALSKKIVIVEDDLRLAEIYKTRLELQGYSCYVAYNGIIALYFIQQDTPDLVLLDLMIPDIAGDEVLRVMRRSSWGKEIPVHVISNLNEADAPRGLRELGITGYSVKANMSNDEIDMIVNDILRPPQKKEDTADTSSN
jgi:DNA-binding response OmpR family regulator